MNVITLSDFILKMYFCHFQYNVEAWPTFKLFRQGRAYEYVGPMEKEKLMEYMKEQEKSPSEEKTTHAGKKFLYYGLICRIAYFLIWNLPIKSKSFFNLRISIFEQF